MVKDSFMHVTFKRFRNDSMKKDLEITHTFFCALFSVETIKDQKYNKKEKKSHQNILFFLKCGKITFITSEIYIEFFFKQKSSKAFFFLT